MGGKERTGPPTAGYLPVPACACLPPGPHLISSVSGQETVLVLWWLLHLRFVLFLLLPLLFTTTLEVPVSSSIREFEIHCHSFPTNTESFTHHHIQSPNLTFLRPRLTLPLLWVVRDRLHTTRLTEESFISPHQPEQPLWVNTTHKHALRFFHNTTSTHNNKPFLLPRWSPLPFLCNQPTNNLLRSPTSVNRSLLYTACLSSHSFQTLLRLTSIVYLTPSVHPSVTFWSVHSFPFSFPPLCSSISFVDEPRR